MPVNNSRSNSFLDNDDYYTVTMDIADIFYANFDKMENRKEHPILFSTPMVQAIIAGRKTMTRRIVKMYHQDDLPIRQNPEWIMNYKTCPYGEVGDLLWVREKFNKNNIPTGYPYNYYADDDVFTDKDSERWKPSIHMPKAAARIWLEVTNVRVERLHDITEIDSIAEGVVSGFQMNSGYPDYEHIVNGVCEVTQDTAVMSFCSLWCKINGKASLESNPWVWVVEFKRIDK